MPQKDAIDKFIASTDKSLRDERKELLRARGRAQHQVNKFTTPLSAAQAELAKIEARLVEIEELREWNSALAEAPVNG